MKKSPLRRKSGLKAKSRLVAKSQLKRSRIKPKKRKPSEFARIYGSRKRVEWVKNRPCVVCKSSPCENAHVVGGGVGRKADARWIVALCSEHHREVHKLGVVTFSNRHKLDLVEWAIHTESAWQLKVGLDYL